MPGWKMKGFLVSGALLGAIEAPASGAQTYPVVDHDLLALPEFSSRRSVCSFRHPLCIHAPPAVAPAMMIATLASADSAWDVLTGALGLPPPLWDLDGVWDVLLVQSAPSEEDGTIGSGCARLRERDPRARYDAATSVALIDRATPIGCALDLALARAVARASLWRAAPATDEGSARAETEALARLAVPCAPADREAEEFASHPERTLVDPTSYTFDLGASLFFDWLDATFSREPGAMVRGLWALAPTRTPPGEPGWNASPTGFDVLRGSLKGTLFTDSSLDDVLARFAVDRAQRTPRVRVAWHIPWPLQARRLASPEPVFPTGASYVVVDHASAPAGSKLRVEAQWEDYERMRWVVVKLDAAGRMMAELPVTSLDRGTGASLTVESLDGVDRVLIVGVNVGTTEHPFNPTQGEWEPHGWLLTLAGE
jgi:hypothetical protein